MESQGAPASIAMKPDSGRVPVNHITNMAIFGLDEIKQPLGYWLRIPSSSPQAVCFIRQASIRTMSVILMGKDCREIIYSSTR